MGGRERGLEALVCECEHVCEQAATCWKQSCCGELQAATSAGLLSFYSGQSQNIKSKTTESSELKCAFVIKTKFMFFIVIPRRVHRDKCNRARVE